MGSKTPFKWGCVVVCTQTEPPPIKAHFSQTGGMSYAGL